MFYVQGYSGKAGVKMKWAPEGVDMPFIYWWIALSTIMWGIASAVAYLEGW